MASQIVSATEFKAKCLALLDEVSSKGGTITVTKRGKPVATVNPVRKKQKIRSTRGILKGRIHIPDDVLMADMSDLWEVVHETEKSSL